VRFIALAQKAMLLICVFASVCSDNAVTEAQIVSGSKTDWLQGKNRQRNSLTGISASWDESPLRAQIRQFAAQRRMAVLLDRRIDPSPTQTYSFADKTAEQIFWAVAEQNDLGITKIDDLLYVGPSETTDRLKHVLAQQKKKLSKIDKTGRKRWLKKIEIRWKDATTTDDIETWLQQKGIVIDGSLPHDVMAAADLPPLPLIDIMGIILAGFDLTCSISSDGSTIQLQEFPPLKTASIRHRVEKGSTITSTRIKKEFPNLKVSGRTANLSIKGPVEDLAGFERWMVMQQKPNIDSSSPRPFSLKVVATRGDVLATIASQTGRKLEFDPNCQDILKERIKLDLKGVFLDELIQACLEGSELQYNLETSALKIFLP
jgi:hypothetical protein